jgi:hypothetical protein
MLDSLQKAYQLCGTCPTIAPTHGLPTGYHMRRGNHLHSGDKAVIIASYLPQSMEDHERACHALARLPLALPHHLLILGGDLQGAGHAPT